MTDQLKELLESAGISEDTVTTLQTLLTEALDAAKEEGKEEGKKEAEEKADADAKAKDEEVEELKESHEAEIVFLKEMANEYGDMLKEKANEYGDMLKEKANKYGAYITESVTGKVKEYADYAIEQFVTENKERFVETEEYDRMRSAFDYIKEAFEQNGFNVREDAQYQEVQQSLVESAEEYEKVFEELQSAREEIESLKRSAIFEKATADLADTQKEKVNELLENVSFDSTEEYEQGLAVIVEQAMKGPTKVETDDLPLQEEVSLGGKKRVDPSVARYLSRPGLL